jgi:zinc transport system substrate-binding protein
MTKIRFTFIRVILLMVALCAGSRAYAAGDAATTRDAIIVTSSMLEQAVRDLLVDVPNAPGILNLVPPGACPGHFDLSPRVLPSVHGAQLILRHDYQGVLEEKIRSTGAGPAPVLVIPTPSSLLIPDNYLKLQKQILGHLAGRFPEARVQMEENAQAEEERKAAFLARLKEQSPAWKGKKAIASAHQKEFAEWLGLEVAGSVARPEDLGPRDLQRLVGLEADVVIANLQEGTQAAQALSERLKKPMAVFSNFANTPDYGQGYWGLLDENVKRLQEGLDTGKQKSKKP